MKNIYLGSFKQFETKGHGAQGWYQVDSSKIQNFAK